MGHASVADWCRDMQGMLRDRGTAREWLDRQRDGLAGALAELAASPLADRMTVFGSMARGLALPGDLDVLLDLGAGAHDRRAEGEAIRLLLGACKERYGLVDGFVLNRAGKLFVRNETASGWDAARHARAILANARKEGVPLREISWSPPADAESDWDTEHWGQSRSATSP